MSHNAYLSIALGCQRIALAPRLARVASIAAALLVTAATATPGPAEARVLRLAEAESAARAAVAPEAVEAVLCFRPIWPRSGSPRRWAFCLFAHPAPPGHICRSLVDVNTPRGRRGTVQAQVIRLYVCMPFPIDWARRGASIGTGQFHLFSSRSEEVVRQASTRAAVRFECVVESIAIGQKHS